MANAQWQQRGKQGSDVLPDAWRRHAEKPAAILDYQQEQQRTIKAELERQRALDATRLHWYISVDLGQAHDPSAIILGTREGPSQRSETKITVEDIKRWPLGTPYPKIVKDIGGVCGESQILNPDNPATLIIDRTGVGRGVVDFLRILRLEDKDRSLLVDKVKLMAVTITGGQSGHATNTNWEWWVPKLDIVTAAQLALQNKREDGRPCLILPPPEIVPETTILIEEMENFRYKPTPNLKNMTAEAWREGDNDDLVLALGQLAYAAQMPSRDRNRWLGGL